ncbi:hypothetical protein FRB94_008216 [Tulasnella sp. JGI-2019a]|nr:hypothetical protein FRB93_004372 [Tulasnella sp. JGI-2019a]KAG8996545.1 hypothetical protein FRB94_008216 [Tulasnella sp. JGI-2019a]
MQSQSPAQCSNCTSYKLICTFVQNAPKRGPPKGYIIDLEKRIKLLEQLIRRTTPNIDIDKEVGPSFNQHTWGRANRASQTLGPSMDQASATSSLLHILSPAQRLPGYTQTLQNSLLSMVPTKTETLAAQEDKEDSDGERNFAEDDGTLSQHLAEKFKKLQLSNEPTMERRFHGKSSAIKLLQAALTLKSEKAGTRPADDRRHQIVNVRHKYWRPSPWEWIANFLPPIDSLRFPPPDLIRILVDRFFEGAMPLMPILHRPSFERQYAENKHRTDFNFAKLLLIVCSVGSRYCKDPRVCLTSPEGEVEWNSAGWIYFAQVYQVQKPLLVAAKIMDLQIMALSAIFLMGTSAPHGAWIIVGTGLRFAVDIGAHREKVYGPDHALDNQLWKRSFWSLVVMDKLLSAMFGRPICIYDEDIDVHLPLEVDDDGWDDKTQSWVQASGKPSELTYLILYAKLTRILEHAIRTVYSISKSKIVRGFIGPEWEQRTVAELDSALNTLLEEVPEHLKWNADMDSRFYQQSASLQITFYYVQMMVHRPFIQLPASVKRASPLSQSSLVVSTHAARATAQVLGDIMDIIPLLVFIKASLISGLVLMMNMREVQRSGQDIGLSKCIADVKTCMRYLRKWQHCYHFAGKACDLLQETASVLGIDGITMQDSTPLETRHSEQFPSSNYASSSGHDTHSNDPPSAPPADVNVSVTPTAVSTLTPSSSLEASSSQYPNLSLFSHATQSDTIPGVFTVQSERVAPATDFDPTSGMQWNVETGPLPSADSQIDMFASLDSAQWYDYRLADPSTSGSGMGHTVPSGPAAPLPKGGIDLMSSNSFLPNGQSIGGNAPIVQIGYWNNEPTAQWNWMSDMPGIFDQFPVLRPRPS